MLGEPVGWALCVAHRGQHGVVEGSCVPVGREVPRPYAFAFGRCAACGADLDYRRDNRTGVVEVLAAGTDERHVHAPPQRVELDEDRLASAIVRAAAAARAERRGGGAREAAPDARPAAPPGSGTGVPDQSPPPPPHHHRVSLD